MAGTYPDVPGPRIAYDRDGSQGIKFQGSTIVVLSAGEMGTLNDEDNDYVATHGGTLQYIGVVFANKYDVVGWHASWNEQYSGASIAALEWSTNTTNLSDGSWSTVTSSPLSTGANQNATRQQARSNIQSVNLSGCKALRFRCTGASGVDSTWFQWMHFYGSPTPGSAPDRLQFWQPTGTDAQVGGAYFDWGDISRGSSIQRSFRIHNPSASLTAQGVAVSIEALTDTSPSNTGQHEFSTDGGTTWGATASLGDLAAGAASGDIILRRNTSGAATLGVWFARLVASATAWI